MYKVRREIECFNRTDKTNAWIYEIAQQNLFSHLYIFVILKRITIIVID